METQSRNCLESRDGIWGHFSSQLASAACGSVRTVRFSSHLVSAMSEKDPKVVLGPLDRNAVV